MEFSRDIQTTMSKWYWVSKPSKFNLRLLFNSMWKHHSDWRLQFLSVENTHLEAALENYDLNNLLNLPTCWQSNNPTCTDLIWQIKKIHWSYLAVSKRVFLITINWSQLFWNQEDSKENLKKKHIYHIGNLSPMVLQKIWNLDWTI